MLDAVVLVWTATIFAYAVIAVAFIIGRGVFNQIRQILDRLNKEINASLADPKLRARLADLGGTPLVGSPADFGKLIAAETEKWAKVIRAANIKPD
jgi:tripartite-type tricarboxylate transporter receptor subunit TctC